MWTPTGRNRTEAKTQLTVPTSLRYEVLKSFHDNPLGGHLGLEKTYHKIRTHFWFGMFKDIQHWVRSCVDCQMRKTPRNRKPAPLLPIPVDGAFDRVAVDCLGPFPESYSGSRYVVVFSDYLTRWPEAFAVSTIQATVIAKLLVNEIFCRHGSPKTLLSDRGKNFLSKLVREVCKLLAIDKLNTSPYHPMTDGLVERFNSFISQSLSMYVSANQKDWDEFLPSILFAYRTSPQATTGDSPFYLLYGREPRLPLDVNLLPPQTERLSTSISEHRERIVAQLEEAQRLAKQNTERTQYERMKERYDLKAVPNPYKIGQRVWVYTPKTQKGLSKKLLHHWHGPFRIVKKISPVNFKLRNSANRLVAAPVHVNRMKPFYDTNDRPIEPPNTIPTDNFCLNEDEIPEDSFQVEPLVAPNEQNESEIATCIPEAHSHDSDDSSVYKIEKILKTRVRKGQKEYLVKWLGYPSEQNSWVPESDMV